MIEETAAWGERRGVVAGITDRGVGSLGFWTAEPVGDVMNRWRDLRRSFELAFPSLIMAHQVHGRRVLWHQDSGPGWHLLDGADGHVTAQRGVLLLVTVADCVPVYLAAQGGGTVALLHAGWRGVAGGMVEAGVAALRERARVPAQDIALHAGVAICGRCYEVGPEVIEAVLGTKTDTRARLDLRAAIIARAEALGVTERSSSPWCTSCHGDRFYSHRASGGQAGRQVAYLGIPPG